MQELHIDEHKGQEQQLEEKQTNIEEIKVANSVNYELDLEKSKAYFQWCKKVGIKCDKLDFPHIFDNNLVGIKVKQKIDHLENLCSVPFTAILTTKNANEPLQNCFKQE